jgi:hypothetical protein
LCGTVDRVGETVAVLFTLTGVLRKQLKGRDFSSDAEVIAAAQTRVDGLHSDFFFFLSGLQKFEQRDKKFVELRGEYV